MGTTAYSTHWQAYREAGWQGVLPLPWRLKDPPPKGYTGDNGKWPTDADLRGWMFAKYDDKWNAGNIGLRLPAEVVGVDIDIYKDPAARQALEANTGPLPPTICSTSRVDGSGIRLYRCDPPPRGQRFKSEPVPAVEIIQRHHRYVVAWPSLHPEGATYRWIDERTGEVLDRPPRVDELEWLPGPAHDWLIEDAPTYDEREATAFTYVGGEMTDRVRRRLARALADCEAEAGSRHAHMTRHTMALQRYAERGDAGVDEARAIYRAEYVDAVGPDRPGGTAKAAEEFDKAWSGARNHVETHEATTLRADERIDLWLGGTDASSAGSSSAASTSSPTKEAGSADQPTAASGDPSSSTESADDGVIELDELLAEEDEPYDWLIEGLIERGDRVILTGQEGKGKSTLLRQFGLMAASGIHPFTRDEMGPIRVLLVDLENSRRQIKRKIRPLRAHAGHQYRGTFNLAARPDGVDLTRGDDTLWLYQRIERHRPDLVIIGPIYKMASGDPKDEQTAKAVSTVLDKLRVHYGFALLIEAHTPYAPDGKTKRPDRPYGASLWSRWPEFGIFLDPEGDLRHWRGQRDERAWPLKLERGEPWPWMVATPAPVVELEQAETWRGPTHCTDACVELLRESGAEMPPRKVMELLRAKGVGYRENTVRDALRLGEQMGYLRHRIGPRNAAVYRYDPSPKVTEMPLYDDRIPPHPTASASVRDAVEAGSNDRIPPHPGGVLTYPRDADAVVPLEATVNSDRIPGRDAVEKAAAIDLLAVAPTIEPF